MTDKELKVILQELEGYRIEFKEKLANVDKDMVAFANASGGRIFIGINDDGNVKGVQVDNELKTQVQDTANNCDPRIRITLEEFKNILIVHVQEGDDKPYKCSSGFYLRVGPNSQKMNRNEIVAFIKAEGKVRFDELVNDKFDFKKDFDVDKLESFLKLAKVTDSLGAKEMLENLGAATLQQNAVVMNNTGVLFFSKNLNRIYPHAAVTCVLYKDSEKVDVLDRKDFNDDIISNIEAALTFLRRNLPVRYEITGRSRRKEILQVPETALREAVINAVAHRDYFERGANVMVEVFDDRIEISNPGGLVKGLSPDNFGKRSVLRNPNIGSLLHRADFIEKMGTGISRMRESLKEAKLPAPEFEFNSFFSVTFRRPVRKVVPAAGDVILDAVHEAIREGVLEVVDDAVVEGLRGTIHDTIGGTIHDTILTRLVILIIALFQREELKLGEFQKMFHVSVRTAKRDMAFLKDAKLIEFSGSLRKGKYLLTERARRVFKERVVRTQRRPK